MMMENNRLLAEAQKLGGVPEGYKDVEYDWFQFKSIGDYCQGKLVEKRKQRMQRGNDVGKYTVIQKNNRRGSFLGSVQLDDLMAGIPLGADIFVQLIDIERQTNDYEIKKFKVAMK